MVEDIEEDIEEVIPQRPLSPWVYRLMGISIFISTALIAGGITWVIKTNQVSKAIDNSLQAFYKSSSESGMRLEQVVVQGRYRTDIKSLRKAVKVKRGEPIFAISLENMRDRVAKLPWVKSVSVRRNLPGVIHLVIKEKEPVAIWQNKGKFAPIDKDGDIIEASVKNLSGLPVVVGEKAPDMASKLFTVLKNEPAMASRVKAAIMISSRRWDLIMDDIKTGITVKLPDKNMEDAWRKLAFYDKEKNLLERRIESVDMRYSDKLVVIPAQSNAKNKLHREIREKIKLMPEQKA